MAPAAAKSASRLTASPPAHLLTSLLSPCDLSSRGAAPLGGAAYMHGQSPSRVNMACPLPPTPPGSHPVPHVVM